MDVVYKQVSTWDTEDVVRWIQGLDECLSEHISQFYAHCICGVDLLKLSRQQLDYLKVSQVGHQELLLEAVELLSALENVRTRNSTIALASTLSKKTSQLINALATQVPSKKQSPDNIEAAALSRLEMTAGVMTAANILVNWLDRNSSSLVQDYDNFRQEVLSSSLDLSSILQENYDASQMQDSCRRILKLTTTMVSPHNFSAVEPVHLVTLNLSPKDETGLGVSIRKTRQGNLLISKVIEGSPAEESGKIRIGAEIIQINQQNVVGWEVNKVVKILKESGHQIALVLRMGIASSEQSGEEGVTTDRDRTGSCDSLEQPTNQNPPPPPPVDLVTNSIITGSNPEEEADSGVHCPSKDLNQQKDPSTPRTSLKKRKKPKTLPTRQDRGEEDDSSVCSSPAIERSGSEKSGKFQHALHERFQHRANSEGPRTPGKEDDVQNLKQYPPVAYKTQVIGGVVMRIPIKQEEQAPRGRKTRTRKEKKLPSPSPSNPEPLGDPVLPSPVEDEASLGKGKAVFSDPKEVVIDGQMTKQVTVSSTAETGLNREELVKGKKANPALLVPCFQLKDKDHEGWMNKLGGSGLTPKNWRRRWFVLKDRKLLYYKTAFDISAMGVVDLVGYKCETAPEMKKKNGFKACRAGARTYYFQPDTAEEMIRWIEVLNKAGKTDDKQATIPPSSSIDADDKSDDEL